MACTVMFSAESKEDDLADMTLRQVREKFAPIFNIPPEAVALVNSTSVPKEQEEQKILKDGDKVEFTKDRVKHRV